MGYEKDKIQKEQCPFCGELNDADANICKRCGRILHASENVPKDYRGLRSLIIVAGVFAIVIGGTFYMRYQPGEEDYAESYDEEDYAESYDEEDYTASYDGEDDTSFYDEEDFQNSQLYNVALANVTGDIKEWCYDDFDFDGNKEAFVATGDDEYYTEYGAKSLWYIGSDGNVSCLIDEESLWYFSDSLLTFDNCKLLYVSARHGIAEIVGVRNNEPVVVNLPEGSDFYWVSQDEETGEVTAGEKKGEYAHVLEFDYDNMEFIDTGEVIAN